MPLIKNKLGRFCKENRLLELRLSIEDLLVSGILFKVVYLKSELLGVTQSFSCNRRSSSYSFFKSIEIHILNT